MFVNWHKNTICFFGILIFLCTFAVQKLGKQNQKINKHLYEKDLFIAVISTVACGGAGE